MAKKSSKHQSKPTNTANLSNTATVPTMATPLNEDIAPVATTAPPSTSPPASVPSLSPYKPITDAISIERLVGLAKDSPPDSALGIVWKQAYEEAYQNGRKEVLQNLGRKLEEKFIEGEKEGIKKGREKYYGKGIVVGECEEHKRWKAAGHGQHCFAAVACLEDSGTQTDSPHTTTTSISIQTNTVAFTATSRAREFVENGVGTHLAPSIAVSTQTTPITTTTASSSVQTNPSTLVATSQHPELPGNQKNTKIHSTSAISPNLAVFSPQTSSVCVLDPAENSTTATALKTRSTMTYLTENHQKIKNLSLFTVSTQATPETFYCSIVEPRNDVTRAHTTQSTPNDVLSQSTAAPTTASSSLPSQPIPSSRHEKSVLLRAIFDSQSSTESPAPTSIVTALKTRSAPANFVENCQKLEKQPIFTQKEAESLISTRFRWADDANELPISSMAATKPPRDFSGLRSSNFSKKSFSSLQRRHQKFTKNKSHFFNSKSQYYCHHTSSGSSFHLQYPHHHLQHPASASFNWDQDPRLADLSKALHALGWVRR
jgi:hypothetical protein